MRHCHSNAERLTHIACVQPHEAPPPEFRRDFYGTAHAGLPSTPTRRGSLLHWTSVAVTGVWLALAVQAHAVTPTKDDRSRPGVSRSLDATSADSRASSVYRCGRTYQQQPCTDGQAIDLAPAPSEEEVKAAKEQAAREREWGDTMERQRVAREREDREALARQQRDARAAALAASAADTGGVIAHQRKHCSKTSGRTRNAGQVSRRQFADDMHRNKCDDHVSYLALPSKGTKRTTAAPSNAKGGSASRQSGAKSSSSKAPSPNAKIKADSEAR